MTNKLSISRTQFNAAYFPAATVPADTVIDSFDPWVEIDTGAMRANIRQVQQRVGETPILAIVKCNAYGHGMVGAARILNEEGIERFGVVKVQEALALREAGIGGMILNMGPFAPYEADELIRHDISQSVFTDAIEDLNRSAQKQGKKAVVHLKIDTGLSRVGVRYDEAMPFIRKAASLQHIHIEGIFTTLTEEDEYDHVQVKRLLDVCAQAKSEGIDIGIRHAASSAAVIKQSIPQLDMVRVGNAFYGFEPQTQIDIVPTMSLKARVILTKTIKPGETIAYHQRGKAEKEMKLAVLPVGYADGYPFHAVNKGDVLIRGRRWPLVVYMSANHVTVDITGNDDIEVGDEVVLFGSQGEEQILISELAQWGHSSEYKVATIVSPFVPRIYKT